MRGKGLDNKKKFLVKIKNFFLLSSVIPVMSSVLLTIKKHQIHCQCKPRSHGKLAAACASILFDLFFSLCFSLCFSLSQCVCMCACVRVAE